MMKYQVNVMVKETKEVVESKEPTTVINIQTRMREKVAEIAGELEGAIDDYIESGFSETKSPFAIMQDKAKGMHAGRIVDIFKKRRIEFDEVLHTKDIEFYENNHDCPTCKQSITEEWKQSQLDTKNTKIGEQKKNLARKR